MRRLAVLAVLTLAVTVSIAPGSPATPARPAAFVRIDQLGYATGATKRAYLLASTPQSGSVWAVRREPGNAPAFVGTVGRSLGRWSTRFPYVYALDFDSLAAAGSYAITAGGAQSPMFSLAAPPDLYTGALHNALSFYEDERDGPDFIRSALRTAPAHLNDAHARTYLTPQVDSNGAFKGDLHALPQSINASGGWWDAGDYLKFVQTTSYVVTLLEVGARDFPAQLGPRSPSSDFTAEARFGVDWLLRMWDDRTRTLYYQVGIGNGNARTISDHDIWRLPQTDDRYGGTNPLYRYIRHRPVFRAAPPGAAVSPNLAGRDASAFALCFQLWHTSDRALADRCLLAAEHIFALADTHPRGHLLTAIPWDFYPETEWRDDLELGATELAIALGSAPPSSLPASLPERDPGFYLRAAANWAHAYVAHATSDTLNLYDVSGLAHYELHRAIARFGDPPGLAVTPADLVADLGRELAAAQRIGTHDPFGFGFPWNVEDTASHGFGLAVMASEYAQLTGDPGYASLTGRWLGNVLGANAWGVSLAIGDGTTFPDCPQHQVANIAGSLDGRPPVLEGAVVEGPSNAASTGALSGMRRCPVGGGDRYAMFNGHGAVFRDNVQSYSTVEPAIDLTASSPLAFAWQIAVPQALP